jgi:hypothetical protein
LSTRSSFFYNHDIDGQIHVFEDLADNSQKIYIEKTQTANTSLALTLEELMLISQSFDLDELKRQASLTDKVLEKAAKSYVDKNLSSSGFIRGLYFAEIPGGEKASLEVQVETVYNNYKKIRQKLKDLLSTVESKSKSVHKFYFGLEQVK